MIARTSSLPAVLVFTAWCVTPGACAQDSELFPHAQLLDTCQVELTFTTGRKVKAEYIEAARALEEQELIYLSYDKKKNKGIYTRVYVMIDENDDGSESMYLETSEDHRSKDGAQQSFMPKYNAHDERFYDAQCFDREVAAFPELNDSVIASPVMKAH